MAKDKKSKSASAEVIDFTNVKEGGGAFNKKRQPEGDYRAKITKVEETKSKSDDTKMWLFTIDVKTGSYPYYCKFQENQLWKIRNLMVAAGIAVPKAKKKVDPNQLIGREIAVTLEDGEYEGKKQSEVAAVFPLSELDEDQPEEEGESEASEESSEEKPSKKKNKAEAEDKGKKEKKGKKDKKMKELDVSNV